MRLSNMWRLIRKRAAPAAIDAKKPERVANRHSSRPLSPSCIVNATVAQALKDHEENRLATLAKPARLRAERSAREAEDPQLKQRTLLNVKA